jgi:hypothetical protein
MRIRPTSLFAVRVRFFFQLTFLHLNFHLDFKPTPWESRIAPNNIFQLSTLQHFGWDSESRDITTSDLLLYAPTLRPLSIQGPYELVILPDLNKFPHLEEHSAFKIQDLKPFPPKYPMHTIYVDQLWSDTRYSLMQIPDRNPVRLRRIHSCQLEWTSVWHSVGDNGMDVVDVEEEDCLSDTCEERGIQLEDAYGLVRSDLCSRLS